MLSISIYCPRPFNWYPYRQDLCSMCQTVLFWSSLTMMDRDGKYVTHRLKTFQTIPGWPRMVEPFSHQSVTCIHTYICIYIDCWFWWRETKTKKSNSIESIGAHTFIVATPVIMMWKTRNVLITYKHYVTQNFLLKCYHMVKAIKYQDLIHILYIQKSHFVEDYSIYYECILFFTKRCFLTYTFPWCKSWQENTCVCAFVGVRFIGFTLK